MSELIIEMNLIEQIEEGAILLVNKPLKWTSFDIVNKIKWLSKRHIPKLKIGHAGTLDPLADGLLIVCTQKMTKQVETIQAQPKTYIATLFLGATRPSFDRETEINQTFPTEHINLDNIKEVLEGFIGIQQQFPPAFSAIKQGGKPIYLKARKGIEVEIKSKEIEIYHIEILDYTFPYLKFEVKTSKGTYIRSLANDIGIRLQSGAYLHHLTRTKIGDYNLENGLEIDFIESTLKSIESKN